MKKKKAKNPTPIIPNEESEIHETSNRGWDASAESPNRVVMPRKIGKHRPEEERGYKPTVI